MLDMMGIIDAAQFFIFMMLSFAFFVGILLLVSHEAFSMFNKDLQKEYGVKKRFFPKIEDSWYGFVDFLLLKYRFVSGLFIAIIAFILLSYKSVAL